MFLDEILGILKNKSSQLAYTESDKSYTYCELYKFICNMYNFIKENHYKGNIVIFGHKEVYMKASMLASALSGSTYVPIDDRLPLERINAILNQVKPSLIIGNLKYDGCLNLNKENIDNILNKENFKEIEKCELNSEDIIYMIFTSGSTGVPKGVQVTYENLDSCVGWLKSLISIENSVVLNQANFSFDLSVADLYLSLITESNHYILNDNKFDFENLFKQLKMSNAEVAVFTPSFAELLLVDESFNQELMPNFKKIIFCGEKLLKDTVQKLYERFENIQIINSYGPTECTFAVTSVEITRDMNEIPVGIPKNDIQILIVDEDLNEVSPKEKGEILILGKSVAKGYLGNANQSAFIEYQGKKGYLTGDIGYIDNGILFYVSRKDSQIKFKGYRIELQDIEENLQTLKYLEKAVVVLDNNNEKNFKIVAFVKLKDGIAKTKLEIKKDLLLKIPEYMCPIINIVDNIPINNNGKCDKNKLLEEYRNGR